MDPVSVAGILGSCGSITELIVKFIKTLRETQEQFKRANLTISLLVSQLTTLKAALGQLEEWISETFATSPQHYQFVMDTETAVTSCSLIISFMDEPISKLKWNQEDELDFESKVRVVLKDRSTKEYLGLLSNQIHALNLLLTAFQCRAQTEQLSFLHRRDTRRILNKVRDDSSSLVVLRDSGSYLTDVTHSTGRSSRLSLKFCFDHELLQSRVYQGTVRSLIRWATIGRSTVRYGYLDLKEITDGQDPRRRKLAAMSADFGGRVVWDCLLGSYRIHRSSHPEILSIIYPQPQMGERGLVDDLIPLRKRAIVPGQDTKAQRTELLINKHIYLVTEVHPDILKNEILCNYFQKTLLIIFELKLWGQRRCATCEATDIGFLKKAIRHFGMICSYKCFSGATIMLVFAGLEDYLLRISTDGRCFKEVFPKDNPQTSIDDPAALLLQKFRDVDGNRHFISTIQAEIRVESQVETLCRASQLRQSLLEANVLSSRIF